MQISLFCRRLRAYFERVWQDLSSPSSNERAPLTQIAYFAMKYIGQTGKDGVKTVEMQEPPARL
jgi:hypothetical protein